MDDRGRGVVVAVRGRDRAAQEAWIDLRPGPPDLLDGPAAGARVHLRHLLEVEGVRRPAEGHLVNRAAALLRLHVQ